MSRVAVLGAGSWGTAFAAVLCDANSDVVLWARRDELAATIADRRENPDYLPGIRLPDALRVTNDAEEATNAAEIVVLAVPSQTCRSNLGDWVGLLPRDAVLVSLMKGVELGTSKRMSEVICEVADRPADRVAIVTGPNLAGEIAHKQPAAAVVACSDKTVATLLQDACNSGYFRPYTNIDVVGCELGGATKNVIALAVGMAAGMGFGDNARASLITRGLAEITRLGVAQGAHPLTFSGLAGLGDLVATCMSPLSRNRTFGEKLGRGMNVDEVVAVTKQVAEGVKSCESILALARKFDVEMPITEQVVGVVKEGNSPAEMMSNLLARDPRSERESHHSSL